MTRLDRQLRWLIGVRLVVITSVLLPYFLLQLAPPVAEPHFDLLYLHAGIAYAESLLYIAFLRLLRGSPAVQAFIQFAGDLLLITGLVYYFGGIASPFSLLYLIVIAVASALLSRRTAMLVATFAYALYAGLLLAIFLGFLPALRPHGPAEEIIWRLTYNLAVHLFGFYAVALLTSFLAQTAVRAERELALQRGSLADLEVVHRDVVQSVPSGLLTTDLAGTVTTVNRAAGEILGQSERTLCGAHIAESGLFQRDEWERICAASSPNRARAEIVILRGGSQVPIGYSLSNLTGAQGTHSGYIVVFQDLSAWHKLQEELRIKDRMAAAGELAAGIAHEVGNPLAAISGSVQMLTGEFAGDPGQRKLLEIIFKESQRLDRTIKGFLRFARPRDRSSVRFDVARLLSETFELLRNSPEVAAGHRFEIELDPPSVHILADPDQVSQIFWNLARNALRAMPGGGTLRVSGQLAGSIYRIQVSDTGKGMSEEQRTKLFQPFQSFFDGGLGIGMAIVYRIVQEHGGRLVVDSGPDAGTTITVELPATLTQPVVALEAHA